MHKKAMEHLKKAHAVLAKMTEKQEHAKPAKAHKAAHKASYKAKHK